MARDAAEISPKFIPDASLLPRDDSGGPEWTPRTAVFGDGGDPLGAKAHLSASGGKEDRVKGTEIDRSERTRGSSGRDKD